MFHGHGASRLTTNAATNPAAKIHAPAATPNDHRMRPMTITASAIAVRLRSHTTPKAYLPALGAAAPARALAALVAELDPVLCEPLDVGGGGAG